MTWFLIGSGPSWIKAYEDSAARPASLYVLVLQHVFCKGLKLGQQDLYSFLMQPSSPTDRFKFKFTEDHLMAYSSQIVFLAYLWGARNRHFSTLCCTTVSISPHFHSKMPLPPTVNGMSASVIAWGSICFCFSKARFLEWETYCNKYKNLVH